MVALFVFLVLVVGVHFALQNEGVYSLVGNWVKTYERVGNDDDSWEVIRVSKPYVAIVNERLLSWDADHYYHISQSLYAPPTCNEIEYAFMPLFPLIWHATNASPLAMCLLNILMYLIGVGVMMRIFEGKLNGWMCLLVLCMPLTIVYCIPYSEALFFVCVAVGLYGYARDSYWLYFIGFMLAAATRSAGNILIVAWMITDILSALRSRISWHKAIGNMGLHLLPLIVGIGMAMLFQHLHGAEHWFEYVIAQRHWDKELSLPQWPFTEWSEESKSISFPIIYAFFIPALGWLALSLLNSVKGKKVGVDGEKWEEMRMLSVLFFVGNIVLALLTQKGCMYSQGRLLTCTPFFLFLVLDISRQKLPTAWVVVASVFLVIALGLCHRLLIKPSTMGLVITMLTALLVVYNQRMRPWVRRTLLWVTIVINVCWTAYLLNCFLNRGWIFT